MARVRRLGAERAKTVVPGAWCLIESGHESDSVWLGKAIARADWGGNVVLAVVNEGTRATQ